MNFFAKLTIMAFIVTLTTQLPAQAPETTTAVSSTIVIGTFSGSVGSLAKI